MTRRMRATRLELFSIEEIALRCEVQPAYVERLVRHGVIEPLPGHAGRFAPEVTLSVQKVVRLQRDLEVNLEGAALILELLDRIEALERRLRMLERP